MTEKTYLFMETLSIASPQLKTKSVKPISVH